MLIDCACPTTVAGVDWVKSFLASLPRKEKELVKVEASSIVYKFGKKILVHCTVSLSSSKPECSFRTEVIEADLPLLIGNSTLKKTEAALHFTSSKMEMMEEMVDMKETDSGHYSIPIQVPEARVQVQRN